MTHPTLFTAKATVGTCTGLLAVGAMLAAYGPAIPQFKAEFGVSDAVAGSAIAIQSVGAVVGVLAAQPVLRRRGNRFTLTGSLILMALGCAVVAGAPSWPVTVAGAALAGLGLGGCDALATQLFVFGQGRRGPVLVNVLHGCFGLGTVLAPLGLAFIGVHNYRLVFAAAAVIALMSAVTMTGLAHRPTPADAPDTPRPSGTPAAKRVTLAVVGAFVLLYVIHFGVQSGVGSWGPTRLLELGHSSESASVIIAAYWTAMVVGRFAVAPLAGRVPASTLVTISCVGTVFALAVAMYSPATAWAYILAGLFIGPIFPNGLNWLAQTSCAPGSAFAYVIAAAMAGAALFPPLLGAVVGSHGGVALAPVLSITAVIAVAACCMITRWSRQTAGTTMGSAGPTEGIEHSVGNDVDRRAVHR